METTDEVIGLVAMPATVLQSITDDHEFFEAMAAYKERTGKWNPDCREVLAVLKSLGYRKAGRP